MAINVKIVIILAILTVFLGIASYFVSDQLKKAPTYTGGVFVFHEMKEVV